MSSDSWKLEKDLCRCCHAEGSFHSLSEPRIILGQEEKYVEMLRSSMNVHLSPVIGLLSEMTYTICEACILRLRDAFNFKRQVLLCEERFKDIYKNVVKSLDPVLNAELVKQEVPGCHQQDIKVEVPMDDDDDLDMGWDDEDADDDKTVLQLQLEDSKKKGKAKAKPKPKPPPKLKATKALTKKKGPVRKTQSATVTEAEPDVSTPKPRKGKELNQHYTVQEVDDKRVFTCDICQRVFKKRMYFKQHYKNVHLQLKLGSCYICGAKVATHLRAAHLEKAHDIPAPACGICNKKFSFPNQVLRHHKSEHMGERNHECSTCNMKFPTKDRLKRHEIKHSPIETFVCNYCGKSFKWKKNLFTHIKIHLNDRRYACALCGMTFVHRTSLRYHMAKHHPNYPSTSSGPLDGVRPDRAFIHPFTKDQSVPLTGPYDDTFTLKEAEDGTKMFTCNTCSRTFGSRRNFTQHFAQVHLKRRPKLRSCHMCDVKVPGHMRAAHMEAAHGRPAPTCLVCNKKFYKPYLVLRHQKSHHMGEKDYKCNVCHMAFETRYKLKTHEIKHSAVRNYKCDFCGKTFKWKPNLRTHILIHLNIRSFICKQCDASFVQQSSLSYHVKKNHPDLV